MKKNICLLIYDLGSGGAERVICKWSDLLKEAYNVYLAVFDNKRAVIYDYSGKYVCLNAPSDNRNIVSKSFIVLKRAKKLKMLVDKKNIDIVISFCNECNLVNTISNHRAKKICSIRNASDLNANKFVKFVIYSTQNTLVVQTNKLKEIIKLNYGNRIEKKTEVIGNPFEKSRIEMMAKQDVPDNFKDFLEKHKTIINVASFKTEKNHVNLLKSFELVCKKIDDVYLLLIGADNGIENKIKDMVRSSQFKHRIVFLGELKNPFAVMSRSTVFCLTSFSEGMPNALAEAMICGVPVISTNCLTGPSDLLLEKNHRLRFNKDGYCIADYGVLTPVFKREYTYDYAEFNKENYILSNVLIKILENERFRSELHQRALKGAEKFDLNSYQEKLLRIVKREID